MGCTCTYSNIDGKFNPLEEEHFTIDSQVNSVNAKELTRVTSMSRISSQRSILLYNFNQKQSSVSIKIDTNLLADLILEEYNIARTNPKYYAFKVKQFTEKIEKEKKEDQEVYYFNNTCGTKIILKNALTLCNDLIKTFENQESFPPLIKNELLIAISKKGMENVKQTKPERENQLKLLFESFSSGKFKTFGSIFGFGDFDPSIIVILQLLDGKDNYYSRNCILNEKFLYCGISVVESEKLKILSLSNFMD